MSPSAKKPYGILRVCRAWRLARATVQRHKALPDGAPRISAKRGPRSFLSDDAVLAEIRAVLAANLIVGEGHRKVWARLREQRGVHTSMRRVLRIMREHGILARDRDGRRDVGHRRHRLPHRRGKRFNNHWIIGRIGYRTPAAHRRILLGEAA